MVTPEPDALEEELNEKYPDLVTFNVEAQKEEMESMIMIFRLFFYGFITVITLIGVTNIFNTITANMELRQKEFAGSIGIIGIALILAISTGIQNYIDKVE